MVKKRDFPKYKNINIFQWRVLYWITIILSTLIIIFSLTSLFLPYESGKNVVYGDTLYFGFYSLFLQKSKNILSINWIGIIMPILVIINTGLCCLTYWLYRWSDDYLFMKSHTLSILYWLLILFTLFLLLLNYMNRDVINLRDKDIVNSGYWTDFKNNDFEFFKFNYLYNIVLAKTSAGSNVYAVNWSINNFGIVWITISSIGCLMIFISFLVLEYYKNKYFQGLI